MGPSPPGGPPAGWRPPPPAQPRDTQDLELECLVSESFDAFSRWGQRHMSAADLIELLEHFLACSRPALSGALRSARDVFMGELAGQIISQGHS